MKREVKRVISFACALLSCLCANGITSFSVYAPYFQSDLHYNQIRVNIVSICAELAMYLSVPFLGYFCDRYSPRPLSLFASVAFGLGYFLAAFTYKSGPPKDTGYGQGWPFGIMALSFFGVGIGTTAMYLSGLATCAKNYAKSKHRGLLLALPITALGLSGGLLICAGLIGALGLQIVDEEELIEERIEELERSGLLEESDFFRPTLSRQNTMSHRSYGTLNRTGPSGGWEEEDNNTFDENDLSESMLLAKQREAELREEERLKKDWLLNRETGEFLGDHTMWYLTAGFFLLIGPGESYMNNLGTIIESLTPSSWAAESPPAGAASTHVGAISVASTIARLLMGTLSDLLAPRLESSDLPRIKTTAPSDSSHAETPLSGAPTEKVTGISRLYLLFTASFLVLLCFLSVSLVVPSHPSVFPVSSALLGFGYGASFSLVPILISVVWGVENFATNWGIVTLMPAGGAVIWSTVYAIGYGNATLNGEDECYGSRCFVGWAWGSAGSVAVAIVLFAGAWRGWRKRGVLV
ncbi:putative mfs monocarboxylic acid [Phaeomoniella chlamydospora]|uniref:Probable transporter MCH1 n=1 Tax=Phaeomoniella chlamydospora TaxID=158046 RepID=A0A0G2EZF0_PHACM|nr:putative mfs monocarboxylic acid [Phaeomoniella chlamydospora]